MAFTKNRHYNFTAIFILLAIVLSTNWFFTFQQVCLKDDNSFYYMPVRMYLSDALHTEGLPYWNPYLMNGVPIHADMQGAVWNPITLILGYIFYYNHTCFLLEYLLYIFLAALGIYKLIRLFVNDKFILFTATIVYTCCGFVSGVANFINWTASIAFIPWLFYFFYKVLYYPNFKNAIWLAIVAWLMLVVSYPAFIIYSSYILLAILLWQYWHWKKNNIVQIRTTIGYFFIAFTTACLFALPAIVSYLEFLPFYNRGKILKTEFAFTDCFYPQFFNSLFIPTSVYNKEFDVLCHSANRDIYFGILPLFFIGMFVANYKKFKNSFVILATGICFFTLIFLFGFLTPLGNFTFNYMPLMGAFKWSASARIFLIIFFIAAFTYYLKNSFTNLHSNLKALKTYCSFFLIGIVAVYVYNYNTKTFETNTHQKIVLLQTITQSILVLILLFFTKKIVRSKQTIMAFIFVDLFINYTLGMAITGVGNVKPSVFNNYAKEFYKQQPHEYLKNTLAENRKLYMFNPWVNHNASKIMNGATFLESNTVFSGYEKKFIVDTANERILRNHAFVYSNEIDTLKIDSIHLTYNSIYAKFTCNKAGNVIFQQNNYKRWQEKNHKQINTYDSCFMQFAATKGSNEISLTYNKGSYPLLIIISVLALLVAVIILFFSYTKKILPT